MALPLIMGLLGSTLGAGATSGVLATLGSVGAGALGSGLGRFLETGDLEEGLKTGAMSFAGGTALKGLLGGMGGAEATKAVEGVSKATEAIPSYGASLTPQIAGQQTFGQNLMNVAQNPISLGQATLAQATVPPPMPKKPDPVEFENRQAGIPRNVDRRPPPDYRPGYDGEFDYGITPNFGVGLMSEDDPRYMNMGGLVGLLGNQKVQDALSNVVGISLNPAMQREANKLMTGEFTPEGYSPLTMADVGMREGGELKPIPEGNKGLPNLPKDVRNKMGFMQEGGVAEVMAPNVEDSKELQTIIIRAARALQGATENPEKDIQVFVEKFGMQALNDLRQRVASGELSFGRDGGIRGMISGEGDGMSDSIEAEIVESAGDPSGSGRPLQVANNEYVVAADVVSDIGNGSSEAGAAKLDRLMKDVRLARHGTTEQPDEKDMMGVMKKAIS